MGEGNVEFHHISVMLEETVKGLVTNKEGIYVDCTLGGAGHSHRIAELLSPEGRIIGIDQDEEAIAAAKERLKDVKCHVDIVHSNFSHLEEILEAQGAPLVDGVVFDLGVSSHQIDTAERGFSYMHDAPLDMRMDPEAKFSAYDVVNTYSEKELDRIFHDYGEERWGRRIAQFIVKERAIKPIERTGELVDIICKAVPKAVRQAASGHPAKRIFQAIRIEVNHELDAIAPAIRAAVGAMVPGGRIAIITFHSLEDRIVKETYADLATGCTCPREFPVCVCGRKPQITLINKKPILPGEEELTQNPRSRSAKLRIAEKL